MSDLRTAYAVALACAAVLATASCSERKADPPHGQAISPTPAPKGSVKITLEPPQGAPMDIQIGWSPFPESEAWVEPMAGMMYAALAECGSVASLTDLQLLVADGALQSPPAADRTEGAVKCLYQHLNGKKLAAAGAEQRELVIRLTPASKSP